MSGLKQLRLNKELELKRSKLSDLVNKEAEFEARSNELAATLEEAKTEEDINLVTEEIDKLEAEQKANDEAKEKIEAEVAEVEAELAEIEQRSKQTKSNTQPQTRNNGGKTMNKLQVRELLKTGEYYERSEVKEFYEKFKNLRAVGGQELTIPDVVVNRIMAIVGDYTTVYPLVDKLQIKGEARILLDTDVEEAEWLEMSAAIPVGNVGTITKVEFDGFKVGKLVTVDNYIIQDSIINLDRYVSKKIARSIGKALDLAILHGAGGTQKQPLGIITQLNDGTNAARIINVANPTGYADLVKPVALIDNGKDASGNVVAVMSRATYYNRCMPFTVQTNAAGAIVGKLPNLVNPDLLGLRVVFSNYVEDDQILFGDFAKYTLVERENITVEGSTHAQFAQDQTAFRGKARFDGKATDIEGFVLVKISGTSNFIGGNKAKRSKTNQNSGGGTAAEQETPAQPTATLRLVKTGDVTTRADNTVDGATIDAQGNITNKRAFSYSAGAVKTVLYMPKDVTEMEFTTTNKHHNILVASDDAQENGVGVSFRDNGLKQYYNLALGTEGTLGTVKNVETVTNEHTPAIGTKYKVVSNADKVTLSFYDTSANAYKEWFSLDKKTITDIQWHTPRLGVIGGISPSNETQTKILGTVQIKTAN